MRESGKQTDEEREGVIILLCSSQLLADLLKILINFDKLTCACMDGHQAVLAEHPEGFGTRYPLSSSSSMDWHSPHPALHTHSHTKQFLTHCT